MLKQLTLDSPVYKKFFDISGNVVKDLSNNANYLLPLKENVLILSKTIAENMGMPFDSFDEELMFETDELFGRVMHYIILDNPQIVKKYFDNSKESKQLQNTRLGVYEVIEINKDNAVLLTNNGEQINIVGEGTGSEFRIGKKIKQGDLIISRLIKLDDGWYIMKNFYYILQDVQKEAFPMLKIIYKQAFGGIKNMLDIEETINKINKLLKQEDKPNITEENINYAKKIKNILLGYLTKKQYKQAEKIIKDTQNPDLIKQLLAYLESVGFPENRVEELLDYVIKYVNSVNGEKFIKEGKKEKSDLNMRLQLLIPNLMEYINKEVKKTGKDPTDTVFINNLKEKWFHTPNPMIGNKTPLEFLQEVDESYDGSSFEIQTNEIGSENFEIDEEEIMGKLIEIQKAMDDDYDIDKAIKILETFSEDTIIDNIMVLLVYILVYMEYVHNKILLKELDSVDDYKKLIIYIDNLYDKLNYLKELESKQDFYKNINDESIKRSINDIWQQPVFELIFNDGIKGKDGLKKIAAIILTDNIIKNDRYDEALAFVDYILGGFDLDDFIKSVRKTKGFLESYEKFGEVIFDNFFLMDLLNYIWGKNKNENELVVDEILIRIDIILRKKTMDEDLEEKISDFNSFVLKNEKNIQNDKELRSKLKDELSEDMIGDIKKLYKNITNKKLKNDFKKCLEILGIM